MSELALGIVMVFVAIGGLFMMRWSLRSGESVTPWPIGPITREKTPRLYWFDLTTYGAIVILGLYFAAQLVT